MKDVAKDQTVQWDGEVASTLPKLVDCVINIVPSILDETFDKTRCIGEIESFLAERKASQVVSDNNQSA